MYQLRLARARSLHTRETRCYHVCPNNSDHAFDSSMFPPAWRERRQRKKWSLGLRYLLIAVTSAPNCTPKPEGLPRPHPTPFPFVLLFFLPRARATSISILSLFAVSCIPRIAVTGPILWPSRRALTRTK